MLDRTSAGALSAIAAALALIALASIAQRAPALRGGASVGAPALRGGASITKPMRPNSGATPAAVRALRDGTRIDLNHAQPADLELLPGIGPSLAQRIVDDRKARGDFAGIDALLRVRGVGPRTLERLRGLLHVEQGRAPPLPAAAPQPRR